VRTVRKWVHNLAFGALLVSLGGCLYLMGIGVDEAVKLPMGVIAGMPAGVLVSSVVVLVVKKEK
jgi:hypothetical protein